MILKLKYSTSIKWSLPEHRFWTSADNNTAPARRWSVCFGKKTTTTQNLRIPQWLVSQLQLLNTLSVFWHKFCVIDEGLFICFLPYILYWPSCWPVYPKCLAQSLFHCRCWVNVKRVNANRNSPPKKSSLLKIAKLTFICFCCGLKKKTLHTNTWMGVLILSLYAWPIFFCNVHFILP